MNQIDINNKNINYLFTRRNRGTRLNILSEEEAKKDDEMYNDYFGEKSEDEEFDADEFKNQNELDINKEDSYDSDFFNEEEESDEEEDSYDSDKKNRRLEIERNKKKFKDIQLKKRKEIIKKNRDKLIKRKNNLIVNKDNNENNNNSLYLDLNINVDTDENELNNKTLERPRLVLKKNKKISNNYINKKESSVFIDNTNNTSTTNDIKENDKKDNNLLGIKTLSDTKKIDNKNNNEIDVNTVNNQNQFKRKLRERNINLKYNEKEMQKNIHFNNDGYNNKQYLNFNNLSAIIDITDSHNILINKSILYNAAKDNKNVDFNKEYSIIYLNKSILNNNNNNKSQIKSKKSVKFKDDIKSEYIISCDDSYNNEQEINYNTVNEQNIYKNSGKKRKKILRDTLKEYIAEQTKKGVKSKKKANKLTKSSYNKNTTNINLVNKPYGNIPSNYNIMNSLSLFSNKNTEDENKTKLEDEQTNKQLNNKSIKNVKNDYNSLNVDDLNQQQLMYSKLINQDNKTQKDLLLESIFTAIFNEQSLEMLQKYEEINKREISGVIAKKNFKEFLKVKNNKDGKVNSK